MDKIKIHVLRTGEVRVSPCLPFGGDDCSLLKASGITTPKSKWIWLPVFSFLMEHPKGLILFDTGWHREMSPDGVYDKKAQIKSLGACLLYQINQGRISKGEAIDEQLAKLNYRPSDIDYVLLSHLDCDHANGLRQVKDARHILVSEAEMIGTTRKNFQIMIRYQKRRWEGVDQSAWIMRRFIDLLQQGLIRQHRTVEYYASRLNITPNYLTECCIKTSRHNASFFIEHFTAEEIARLLKREDLSITDVAYQLDFNTTNYFTRYVKRVLGMTPSQYKAKFSVKK